MVISRQLHSVYVLSAVSTKLKAACPRYRAVLDHSCFHVCGTFYLLTASDCRCMSIVYCGIILANRFLLFLPTFFIIIFLCVTMGFKALCVKRYVLKYGKNTSRLIDCHFGFINVGKTLFWFYFVDLAQLLLL